MQAQLRLIVIPAVGYAVLNVLWMLAGNTGDMPEERRTILKNVCLVSALLLFLFVVLWSAWRQSARPAAAAALNAGAGVALGFLLVTLTGVLWGPVKMFRDGNVSARVVQVFMIACIASVCAATAAAALGTGVDWLRRSSERS